MNNPLIKYPLYEDLNPVEQMDEAYYATMLTAAEEDEEPIARYKQIELDIAQNGYSSVVNNAKQKWVNDQDENAKNILTEIIEDPTIKTADKKDILNRYNNLNYSDSLKDRFINGLNSQYIIANNLDQSESFIIADQQTEDLQWEQVFEDIEKAQIEANENPDKKIIDEVKAQETIDRVFTGLKDPGYIPVIDDIAFLGSMLIHLPDYFWELVDTWAATAGVDIPNWLNKNQGSANTQGVKKVTTMRELIQENRKTALTKEVADGVDNTLKIMGIDNTKFSVVGKGFELLGEAIQYISNKMTSDDPGKTSLILETLILLFGPKGIRAAKKSITNRYKNTNFAKDRAYKKETGKDTVEGEFEVTGFAQGEKQSGMAPVVVTGSTKGKGEKIVPDGPEVNTPFASTNRMNPEMGKDLIDAVIVEPSVGEQIGFSTRDFALKQFDPLNQIMYSKDIGIIPDSSYMRQFQNDAKRDLELTLVNTSDPNYSSKIKYIEEQYDITKEILKDNSMVMANSLNTYVGLQPTGLGFNFGQTFKKTPTEDWNNPKEVMAAYTAVKEKILKHRGYSLKDIENNINKPIPIENMELAIHEVIPRDSTYNPVEIYIDGIVPEANVNNNFIIRWSENTSFTDLMTKKDAAESPRERFKVDNTVEDLFGNLEVVLSRTLFKGSSKSGEGTGGVAGGTARWVSPFNIQPKKIEQMFRQEMLKIDAFGNTQRKKLSQFLLKNLSSKEQNLLKSIYYKSEDLGLDFIRNKSELIDLLPINITDASFNRIQKAFNIYKLFLMNQYRYENLNAYNTYMFAGYKNAYILEHPNGVQYVQPLMKNFKIDEGYGIPEGVIFDEVGNNYKTVVIDSATNKPTAVLLSVDHMMKTNEIWIFDPSTNLPIQQLYRSPFHIENPNKPNEYYSYTYNSKSKAMNLPATVVPNVDGYVPRINKDDFVVYYVPKEITLNGKLSNKSSLVLDDINNPYLDSKKFLGESIENARREIMETHDNFGRVDRTFKNLSSAKKYIKDNQFKRGSKWLDSWVFIKKSANLKPNVIRQYYETESTAALGKRMRGENVKFDSIEGPYTSMIQNSYSHGKRANFENTIRRFEQAFVDGYVKPEKESAVIITPNAKKADGTVDPYPVRVEQISPKVGEQEAYAQAIELWNQIERFKTGVPNKVLANGIANLSDSLSAAIEESIMAGKKPADYISRKGRSLQQNSRDAANIGSNMLTYFKITLSPLNMLLVQSPAAFAALMSYGQNPRSKYPDPRIVIQNFKQYGTLLLVAAKKQYQLTNPEKLVWDKALDELNFKGFDKAFPETPEGFLKGYGEAGKFTTKDAELLLREGEVRGIFDFGNHEMLQNLFTNSPKELGQAKNVWSLKDSSAVFDIANPKTWFSRAVQISGKFFPAGEKISRYGHAIASKNHWIQNNPGKDWRNPKALDQIFNDIDLLAGSMHPFARYAWMDTSLGNFFGKFVTYPNKIAWTSSFNKQGRIGTAPQAWASNAWWLALATPIGMTMLNYLDHYMRELLDLQNYTEEEKDLQLLIAKYSYTDYIVSALVNGYEEDLEYKDILKISDKFTPFGMEGGHIVGVGKNLIHYLIYGDKNTNLGVTLSTIREFVGDSGTLPLLVSLYEDPVLSGIQKTKVTSNLLLRYIPFAKSLTELQKQLINNDITTRTGQPLGTGNSDESLIAMRTLLGIPQVGQTELFEMLKDDSERKKLIQRTARYSLMLFNEAFGRQFTIDDLKKHRIAYVEMLSNVGLLTTTIEEYEWISTFERMVARQDITLMQQLIQSDMDDLVYQKVYKVEDRRRFEQLKRILPKDHHEHKRIDKILENMKHYDQKRMNQYKENLN